MRRLALLAALFFATVASCPSGKICHIVVIEQENRTVDNLFQAMPGANTVNFCVTRGGSTHTMTVEDLQYLPPPYNYISPSHTHLAFLSDLYPTVANNNNPQTGMPLGTPSNSGWAGTHCQYVGGGNFVGEAGPYIQMAEAFSFANDFFQLNQGPSMPGHYALDSGTTSCLGAGQYLFAAAAAPCTGPTPWPIGDNPGVGVGQATGVGASGVGGCASPTSATNSSNSSFVNLINYNDTTNFGETPANAHFVFPCFATESIFSAMATAGWSWRVYQAGTAYFGYWSPGEWDRALFCGAFAYGSACQSHLSNITCYNSGTKYTNGCYVPATSYTNNVQECAPSGVGACGNDVSGLASTLPMFLADLGSGTLANLTYITPTDQESDHSSNSATGYGPSYVAAIVNAIGASSFWSSTAIFVVWDDWGGWFDHVCPNNAYVTGNSSPTWWNASAASTVCDTSAYLANSPGYRVPLIVISPYSKPAYITANSYDFGSILKYIEGVFSLSCLAQDCSSADFTSDIFNYSQTPNAPPSINPPLKPLWLMALERAEGGYAGPADNDFDSE